MLEKIVERFCDSPTQYRYLLQTERTVEKRALEGKNDLSNMSLAITCVFGFIISVLFTFMPFILSMDTFTYALMGITMSMTMVGIWTIPYFDILLSPINYPVIAHTPVSSRTYFLVKLTHVLTYTLLLLASLNLLPAFGGIQIRAGESSQLQFFFPFVYLPIAFISFGVKTPAIHSGDIDTALLERTKHRKINLTYGLKCGIIRVSSWQTYSA